MPDPTTKRGLSLTVTRTLRASAARIFDAWTRPEHMVRWWGPTGFTARDVSVDLRPGGRFRITMVPPQGEPFMLGGEYREIVPGVKLVMTWRYDGPGVTDHAESVVTVELAPEGDGTRLTLTHVFAKPSPAAAQYEQGWAGSLDKLEAALVTPTP